MFCSRIIVFTRQFRSVVMKTFNYLFISFFKGNKHRQRPSKRKNSCAKLQAYEIIHACKIRNLIWGIREIPRLISNLRARSVSCISIDINQRSIFSKISQHVYSFHDLSRRANPNLSSIENSKKHRSENYSVYAIFISFNEYIMTSTI